MQTAANTMKAQDPLPSGDRGWIINIGSATTYRGSPYAAVYSATKAAVQSLTDSTALGLSPYRIHCHSLIPATTRTKVLNGAPDEFIKSLEEKQPLGLNNPEDLAGPAVFLVTDEARMMQGCKITVDGGFLLV